MCNLSSVSWLSQGIDCVLRVARESDLHVDDMEKVFDCEEKKE